MTGDWKFYLNIVGAGWTGGVAPFYEPDTYYLAMSPEDRDWLALIMQVAINNLPPAPDPNTVQAIELKDALENPLDHAAG